MLAEGFNGEGIRGIIPNSANVDLRIARVFGDQAMAMAKTSTIEKAMEWCADEGAKVINMSLASDSESYNSQRLIDRFVLEENILLVGASGNWAEETPTDPSYPAAYENVISVGSIGRDWKRSVFSQYGPTLDLVAPGDDTLSTVPSSALIDDESITLDAGPMAFTPVPNSLIEGPLVDCGNGENLCQEAAGKVCLMEAKDTTFLVMAQNCEDGGGVGLVIYPGDLSENLDSAYMDLSYKGSISVVTVSRESGLRLSAKSGRPAKISFTVPAYRTASGTSMSTAHVSGVIARLWGALPQCTNLQIREALETTAFDLGPEGRDDEYGYGLVQALSAYHWLLDQPPPCGSGEGSGGFEPQIDPDSPSENKLRPVDQRKIPSQHIKQGLMLCNGPFCKALEGAGRRLYHGLRLDIESQAQSNV